MCLLRICYELDTQALSIQRGLRHGYWLLQVGVSARESEEMIKGQKNCKLTLKGLLSFSLSHFDFLRQGWILRLGL